MMNSTSSSRCASPQSPLPRRSPAFPITLEEFEDIAIEEGLQVAVAGSSEQEVKPGRGGLLAGSDLETSTHQVDGAPQK